MKDTVEAERNGSRKKGGVRERTERGGDHAEVGVGAQGTGLIFIEGRNEATWVPIDFAELTGKQGQGSRSRREKAK